ncbi:MAG: sulfur carrier protein ThiS [Myxococcales bacterium]|nr:sulfur carrier protein ThiS [Myxococcales bacterium]
MQLEVNGEKKEIPQSLSLAEALRLWGYDGLPVAVACNEEFVPRRLYAETLLNEGDRVEIVSPMQGG